MGRDVSKSGGDALSVACATSGWGQRVLCLCEVLGVALLACLDAAQQPVGLENWHREAACGRAHALVHSELWCWGSSE